MFYWSQVICGGLFMLQRSTLLLRSFSAFKLYGDKKMVFRIVWVLFSGFPADRNVTGWKLPKFQIVLNFNVAKQLCPFERVTTVLNGTTVRPFCVCKLSKSKLELKEAPNNHIFRPTSLSNNWRWLKRENGLHPPTTTYDLRNIGWHISSWWMLRQAL